MEIIACELGRDGRGVWIALRIALRHPGGARGVALSGAIEFVRAGSAGLRVATSPPAGAITGLSLLLATSMTGIAGVREQQVLLGVVETVEQLFLRVGQLLQRVARVAQILGALP